MYLVNLREKRLQADLGANSGSETGSNQDTVIEDVGNNESAEDKQDTKETKTFTQDEIDKIVSKRLDRAQKKWEQETEKRIEELKMAAMSPEEKKEYEKSKLGQELSKKEIELQRREIRLEAIDKLQEKGLGRELADLLDCSSLESVESSITVLEKAIQKSVETIVNTRLRGKEAPKGFNTNDNKHSDAFLKGLKGSR